MARNSTATKKAPRKKVARKTTRKTTKKPANLTLSAGSDYVWRKNMACFATYKVLERDDRMDEFEEESLPFDQAGDKKLSELRYWPVITRSANIRQGVSYRVARQFLGGIANDYAFRMERPDIKTAEIIRKTAALFRSSSATIKDLAAYVDSVLAFGDEWGG